MKELKFPEPTAEKLEVLNYYLKIWFSIVNRQKTNIVDFFAGTGYNKINGVKRKGTALISVDLFEEDYINDYHLYLSELDFKKYNQLKKNIKGIIQRENLNIKLDNEIVLNRGDWVTYRDEYIRKTSKGISFYILDPTGIEVLPWEEILPLLELGMSKFEYKESGNEIIINWAWHAIRRKIGKYYSLRKIHDDSVEKGFESDLKNLDEFFGPVNWKDIVDTYPPTIFDEEKKQIIQELCLKLVFEYIKNLFKYFRYICLHPVYHRKKFKADIKKRGKIKYFLIFMSNYQEAPKIIGTKFREYIEKRFYVPQNQSTLNKFLGKNIKGKEVTAIRTSYTINEKIENLERSIGRRLSQMQKDIIKYLYYKRNHDYGSFEDYLYKEFNINSDNPQLNLLIEQGVINKRPKSSKSSNFEGGFFYLDHPCLVNRNNYLYYNKKIYQYKDAKFEKII